MSATTSDASSITVVLVHGAFADSSSWNGVIERLQADGMRLTAPANPRLVRGRRSRSSGSRSRVPAESHIRNLLGCMAPLGSPAMALP